MKQVKFSRLAREFPCISKILTDDALYLSTDSIGDFKVKRGDVNLLEVTPSAWSDDSGMGEFQGHRFFWIVDWNDEVTQLKSSWCRSIVPHGTRSAEDALPIGRQLFALNKRINYIVEIGWQGWDDEDISGRQSLVVYKMHGFDWLSHRRFAR
ncbi:MAG: hypothetical protein WAU28_05545 [Candidatus Moraniibacteriota bacterium]